MLSHLAIPFITLYNVVCETSYGPPNVSTPESSVSEELVKESVVAVANAAAHPRTVMVHAGHALLADGAVVSARRLDPVARLTVTVADEVVDYMPVVAEAIVVDYDLFDAPHAISVLHG